MPRKPWKAVAWSSSSIVTLRLARAAMIDGNHETAYCHLRLLCDQHGITELLEKLLLEQECPVTFCDELSIKYGEASRDDSAIYLWCAEVGLDILQPSVGVHEVLLSDRSFPGVYELLQKSECRGLGRLVIPLSKSTKAFLKRIEKHADDEIFVTDICDYPRVSIAAHLLLNTVCKWISDARLAGCTSVRSKLSQRTVLIGSGIAFHVVCLSQRGSPG